jgi:hypothetical protein
MTTIEILEFTEAKDFVIAGRFNEALPKLYRLAGSYPQDQEIQDLIKRCLSIQQPLPQPIYYPQPYYGPPPVQIINKASSNRWAFLISGLGVIATIVSLFLTWLKLEFDFKSGLYELSFNGFGGKSGSLTMLTQVEDSTLAKLTDKLEWWYVVFGIILLFIIVTAGIIQPTKNTATLLIVVSLFFTAYLIYKYFVLIDFSTMTSNNIKTNLATGLTSESGLLSAELGPVVAIIGGTFTFVFSIVADSLPYKN